MTGKISKVQQDRDAWEVTQAKILAEVRALSLADKDRLFTYYRQYVENNSEPYMGFEMFADHWLSGEWADSGQAPQSKLDWLDKRFGKPGEPTQASQDWTAEDIKAFSEA